MREIKFRAWDRRQKKWVSEDIALACDGKISIANLNSTIRCVEDLEIVFYTGLKDKNGKEIYEGDIVKASDKYTSSITVVEWDEEIDTDRYWWNAVGFSINFDDNPVDIDFGDGLEVIGNIYENKELLK